jgi:hypothetical protein
MTETLQRNRFFSDFYDSIFQRRYDIRKQTNPLLFQQYIGRLRFDAILHRKIVLIDTQLLDGAFFLDPQNSPDELIKKLSRNTVSHPIEIRARDANLENSLLLFVKDFKNGKMKEFSFSGIRDSNERAAAKQAILDSSFDEMKTWQDILVIFKSAGVNQTNIEQIESSWSKWLELQSNGKLLVLPWKWERGFPIEKYIGGIGRLSKDIFTDDVNQEAKFISEHLSQRSMIDIRFSEFKEKWEKSKADELSILEARYHRAYDKAAAWQHECGSFESTITNLIEMLKIDVDDINVKSELEKENDEIVLDKSLGLEDIDPFFLYKLGGMEDGKFADYFWQNTNDFLQWWNHGNMDALDRAIEPIVQHISDIIKPDHEHITNDNALVDFIQLGIEVAYEVLPDWAKKLFSGLNDIRIKYLRVKNSKENLQQRIIDIARERSFEDEQN